MVNESQSNPIGSRCIVSLLVCMKLSSAHRAKKLQTKSSHFDKNPHDLEFCIKK